MRPWALPGSPLTHRLAGAPLIAAGTIVIARSLRAAGQVDLDHPRRLVTTGPYAASRNPMYAGWALLHVGAAVAGGSFWMLAAFAAATGQVHRLILGEERELGDRFGDEFGRYRAAVPRYLPRWPRKGHRPLAAVLARAACYRGARGGRLAGAGHLADKRGPCA